MGKLFLVGDVHGQCNKLRNVMYKIKKEYKEDDYIIFLGDYVDRGRESLEVIRDLLKIKERCNVRYLKGNHDSMFVDCVNYFSNFEPTYIEEHLDEYTHYLKVFTTNHVETLNSFIRKMPNNYKYNNLINHIRVEGISFEISLEETESIVRLIKELCTKIKECFHIEFKFLEDLEVVLETDRYILSHSGGSKLKPFDLNTENDWLWSRDYNRSIDTDKYFIVGHTPTQSGEVEIDSIKKHIFIDTGSVYNGCDIGLYISDYKYIKGVNYKVY